MGGDLPGQQSSARGLAALHKSTWVDTQVVYMHTHTHACLRFSSATTALNYTPTVQAPDHRSFQRNWIAHLAEKYRISNPGAVSHTYTLCDTSRQRFELCSSDRPAWVYFRILVTLGLCFKLPCMQASKQQAYYFISNGWLLNVSSFSTLKVKNPQLIKLSHEISVANAHFEWFRVKASNANLQNKKNTFCGCKDKKILYSTDKWKIRCLALKKIHIKTCKNSIKVF